MVQLETNEILKRIEIIHNYGISTEGYRELEKFRDELREKLGLPKISINSGQYESLHLLGF